MSVEIDPSIVRQLATEHILDHARRGTDVAADVMGHFGPGALEREAFDAWCEAIREAIKTATLIVGWPDAPQLPDDADDTEARELLAGLRANVESFHQPVEGEPWHCTCGAGGACGNGRADHAPIDVFEHALDWVQAARTAATAEPADFEITALHECEIRETWVHVIHTPCQETVFGGPDDYEDLDAGELLQRMATHRCETGAEAGGEPRDVSQIIDVEVDGATVTAAFHGSRQLDAQEQEAMGEIVRATARLQREKEREQRWQRDEDVRAVDRLLRELRARTGVDALKAVTRLEERYADRIADLQQRDAEGTVSNG